MPKTKEKIVDMLDHHEMLLLYREYVDQCIEDNNYSNPARPVSFDDWKTNIFKVDEDTTVITLDLTWEGAEGGQLTGSCGPESFQVRVPVDFIATSGAIFDSAGMRRLAKKFADKMNRRLPTVLYRGKIAYKWSWD